MHFILIIWHFRSATNLHLLIKAVNQLIRSPAGLALHFAAHFSESDSELEDSIKSKLVSKQEACCIPGYGDT